MFEEQYRKMNQELNPSPELNDETVALMKEAQDHRATEPPKRFRLRPAVVIPLAGTVAAALVVTVLLSFWLGHGNGSVIEDSEGSFEVLEGNSQTTPDAQEPEEEEIGSQPENTEKPGDEGEPSTPEASYPSTGTDPEFESSAPSDDESEEQEPADPPEDEEGDEEGNSGGEAPPSAPVDPRDPDVINDDTTATYTTIREFLTALAQKTTPGYGKNYYNARDLLIVPAKLPEQTRFRHMHLNIADGSYSYAYLFAAGGKEYFLDIEVDADTPKTLRDLNMKKQSIATEKVQTGQKGNQLFFLFGEKDYITVTVTEVNSTVALTEEQVTALLAQFELERCSITNTLIDMKY